MCRNYSSCRFVEVSREGYTDVVLPGPAGWERNACRYGYSACACFVLYLVELMLGFCAALLLRGWLLITAVCAVVGVVVYVCFLDDCRRLSA